MEKTVTRDKAMAQLVPLQQKIIDIQNALRNIEEIRRKLQENASKTTSDIHTTMGRQLESLRNREVWLCEQVQLLKVTKEETLSKQCADLLVTLGQLESCMQCAQSLRPTTPSPHAPQYLASARKAVENCIKRCEKLELSAKEDACISFQGDISALKTFIQKFGMIESEAVCAAALGGPGRVSPSLPAAVEEYEDAQHHVLYKPLEPFSATPTVTLRAPRAPKPEDWLWLPLDVNPSMSAATDSKTGPMGVSESGGSGVGGGTVDVQSWLAAHKLRPSASTERWLTELQSQCAVEEEPYQTAESTSNSEVEMISHADCTSISDSSPDVSEVEAGWLQVNGTGTSVAQSGSTTTSPALCGSGMQYPYFSQVLQQPATQWLLNGDLASVTAPMLKLKHFEEMSGCLSDWLCTSQDRRQGNIETGSSIAMDTAEDNRGTDQDLVWRLTESDSGVSTTPASSLSGYRASRKSSVDRKLSFPSLSQQSHADSLLQWLHNDAQANCVSNTGRTSEWIKDAVSALGVGNDAKGFKALASNYVASEWLSRCSSREKFAAGPFSESIFPKSKSCPFLFKQEGGDEKNPWLLSSIGCPVFSGRCPIAYWKEIHGVKDEDWVKGGAKMVGAGGIPDCEPAWLSKSYHAEYVKSAEKPLTLFSTTVV